MKSVPNRYKALALAAFVVLGALLLRGPLFRAIVEYRTEIVVRERPRFVRSTDLIAELRRAAEQDQTATLRDLVELAASRTASRLSYRWAGGTVDPDVAATLERTNCIGYAALFGAVLNELLDATGRGGDYRTEHVRGRTAVFGVVVDLRLFGVHLSEHDYNVVSEHRDGAWFPVYYVDAGVSDTFGILLARGRR